MKEQQDRQYMQMDIHGCIANVFLQGKQGMLQSIILRQQHPHRMHHIVLES